MHANLNGSLQPNVWWKRCFLAGKETWTCNLFSYIANYTKSSLFFGRIRGAGPCVFPLFTIFFEGTSLQLEGKPNLFAKGIFFIFRTVTVRHYFSFRETVFWGPALQDRKIKSPIFRRWTDPATHIANFSCKQRRKIVRLIFLVLTVSCGKRCISSPSPWRCTHGRSCKRGTCKPEIK